MATDIIDAKDARLQGITPDQSDEVIAKRAREELARLEEALEQARERERAAREKWQVTIEANGWGNAREERNGVERSANVCRIYWHMWATAVRIVAGVSPD